MSQSALKKIAALRRCGGLLSRLACERDRKEGVDVEVLLRQAHLTSRESGGQEDLFFHIGLTWRRTFMTRCAGFTFRDLGCCQRTGYRQRVHCERQKKYDYAATNPRHNPCFRCRLHISLQFVCSWVPIEAAR
jgi:hypothetical protein